VQSRKVFHGTKFVKVREKSCKVNYKKQYQKETAEGGLFCTVTLPAIYQRKAELLMFAMEKLLKKSTYASVVLSVF
jgi:hypothetical protein